MSNRASTCRQPHLATAAMGRRLARAAVLTALLLPLGAVTSDAATIACVTSFNAGGTCSGTGSAGTATFSPESGSNTWKFFRDFDQTTLAYTLEITGLPTSTFDLKVNDFVFLQSNLAQVADMSLFPGTICLPIFSGNDGGFCARFDVSVVAGTANWVDGYYMEMRWFVNSDPDSQPPNDGNNHILQAPNRFLYTNTLADPFYDPQPVPNDPALGGKGDNFSGFLAVRTIVPEPSVLVLLGTGVAAALCRRRRTRR